MRDSFNCPVEDCDNCKFNRSQSWCARALTDYKGHTELEKIRMEGFWEAIDWCEKHYKWMEDHWDKLDAYTVLVTKILEECYVNGRVPTEADMFMIDSFGKIKKVMKEIRKDCFWYRPWKDMSATFNQCELKEMAECPCTENCVDFITKNEADELIRAIQLGEIET